jgi:hypothetical protein
MKDFMHKLLENNVFLRGLLTAFLAAVLSVATPVAAQDDPLDRLFTIRAVKVDETAARASEARRVALGKAEQEAYAKLMRKLTQPEGRERLPELSARQVQAMISGIEVVEEQSSSRRYLATLDVRFEPELVSRFLAEHDVPHVLGTGRGILVVHAHGRGLDHTLWERDQAVISAREQVDWLNRIRSYVFPRGIMAERAMVTVEEVQALDARGAEKLAPAYNVRSSLLIASDWRLSGGGWTLFYRYAAPEEGIRGQGTVSGADTETQALVSMYDDALEAIDGAWRARLLVDTGVGGQIETLVPASDLAELITVQEKLEEVSLVGDVSILEIGLPASRIRFSYTGREDQLVLALRYAGLNLSPYGDRRLLTVRADGY